MINKESKNKKLLKAFSQIFHFFDSSENGKKPLSLKLTQDLSTPLSKTISEMESKLLIFGFDNQVNLNKVVLKNFSWQTSEFLNIFHEDEYFIVLNAEDEELSNILNLIQKCQKNKSINQETLDKWNLFLNKKLETILSQGVTDFFTQYIIGRHTKNNFLTPTKPKEVIISSNFLSLDEVSQVIHKLVNHSSINGFTDNYYNFGDNDYFGFSDRYYTEDIKHHFKYLSSPNLSPKELQESLETKNVFTLIEKHNSVFITEKKKYLYQVQEGENLMTSPLFYLTVDKNEFYSKLNSWWDSKSFEEKGEIYTQRIRGMITTIRYHLTQLLFIRKEDFLEESRELISFVSRLTKFLLTTDDKLYYDEESDKNGGRILTAHYNNDIVELLGIFRDDVVGNNICKENRKVVLDKLNIFNNLFLQNLQKEIKEDTNFQLVISLSKIMNIDSMFELYKELGESFEFENVLSIKPAIVVNVQEAIDNITWEDCWLEEFEALREKISDLNQNCSFNLVITKTELKYATEELNNQSIQPISTDELIELKNLLKQVQSLPLLKQ